MQENAWHFLKRYIFFTNAVVHFPDVALIFWFVNKEALSGWNVLLVQEDFLPCSQALDDDPSWPSS